MSVFQPVFKVILLGEAGVGKSSVFGRVRNNVFTECSKTTLIGIDSCTKVVTYHKGTVKICLYDTAGCERFRTITRNYFRNTDAVLLMFNMNDPDSLVHLSKWADDASYYSKSACRFLIGNKNDLKQMVDEDNIKKFALRNDCDGAFFVSAKTGEGLNNVLQTIAERLANDYQEKSIEFSQSWLTDSGSSRKDKSNMFCCS